MDELWVGHTYGMDDDAPELVQAFRFFEALAHIAGHRTALDEGLEWAREVDERLARGEEIKMYSAEELIAELRLKHG